MKRIIVSLGVLVGIGLQLWCSSVVAATSVTQFGITWSFADDETVGQFANGDYWVVGPVSITNISPASVASGGRTNNGSMINPPAGLTLAGQGYDSALALYTHTNNVGFGVSPSTPLVVGAGSSLISMISDTNSAARPVLTDGAVLTVLSESPPAGSFRPPYSGTNKVVQWNTNQIQHDKLPRLPDPTNIANLAEVSARFERPWFDHVTGWTGDYAHPKNNMPNYGREIAYVIGDALLMLALDNDTEAHQTLLIRIIQLGIDLHGIAVQPGALWIDDGGNGHGRKAPIMFAAMMLGATEMMEIGNAAEHFIFQEDRQTWYVTEYDVGRTLIDETHLVPPRYHEEYVLADVGIAEWGERHIQNEAKDGRNWDAVYRLVVGPSILPHVLAARIYGFVDEWNWPALFDYTDRYWSIMGDEEDCVNTNTIKCFHKAMWAAYRNYTPSDPDPPSPSRTTRATNARVGTIQFK